MSQKNKYALIFMDADDTLFDFQQCERNAILQTCLDHGIESSEELIDRYRIINHRLWGELEKGKLSQDEIKHERFRQLVEFFSWKIDYMEMSRSFIRNISEERVLMDGAEEICRYLNNTYTLFLLTNGISEIQRSRFGKSHLHPYFSKIIISDEACCSKPDPGIFEWSLKDTVFKEKEEMLIIGDSLTSDIQGGINFGIDTCWFNPAGHDAGDLDPDFIISDLMEIRNFL